MTQISKEDYTDFLPGKLEAQQKATIEDGVTEDKKGVLRFLSSTPE